MAKRTNQTSGKGILDLKLNEGIATITKVDKDGGETVFNFLEILDEYDGKTISFNIKEDVEINPVSEEY